jgi:hypothetical protein
MESNIKYKRWLVRRRNAVRFDRGINRFETMASDNQ